MTQSPLPAPRTARLWVGTYPSGGPNSPAGTGEGIWRLDLDLDTGSLQGVLAAEAPSASFLAVGAQGSTLYAVGETDLGTVASFALDGDGGLTELDRVSSGGAAPCHLLLDPRGRALYVACYGSGTVGVLPLAQDGGFAPEVLRRGEPVQVLGNAAPGSGAVPDRQDAPHAHSTILSPDGVFLLVADLGTDQLRRLRVRADGLLDDDGVACALPPGTGPRHLAYGAGGDLYVVGELSGAVHVLAWDAATGTATQVGAVAAASQESVAHGSNLPAHVVATPERVLVSVRGADVVSELSVLGGSAELDAVQDVRVDAWPRHFTVVGRWVVVAAQHGRTVMSLRRSPDGLFDGVADRFELDQPACVVAG